MRQLIINADDFGVSEGANRAIAETHAAGILSSASLLVNMAATEQAVALAKDTHMNVGIHLCLASGRPINDASTVPSLVDASGRFWNRSTVMRKLLLGSIRLDEIQREFEAQVERFLKFGLSPDHVDSDQHVHVLPGIGEIALGIAKSLGVPLRVPGERIYWAGGGLPGPGFLVSKMLLNVFSWRLRRDCQRWSVKCNDHFASIFGFFPHQPPRLALFERLLRTLPRGLSELMVHPAYADAPLEEFWEGGPSRALERESELRCLLSPTFARMLSQFDFSLTSYSKL